MLAPFGNNFNMLRADNVLPDPDSPTIAVVLPFATSIFTFLTTSVYLLKPILKLFIYIIFSILIKSLSWVQ